MSDLRVRGGVPYGYNIRDGDAVINTDEAEKLTLFFDYFMGGMPMTHAAKEAGLRCAKSTLPNLFTRKEYTGTDYYPQIITEDYQKQLIAERQRRIDESNCTTAKKIWQVRIHTEFDIGREPPDLPEDPMRYIEAMYELIIPKNSLTEGETKDGNTGH